MFNCWLDTEVAGSNPDVRMVIDNSLLVILPSVGEHMSVR